MRSILRRTAFLGALGFAAALLLPTGAGAGVATSGAVLLDPFDPVPEIQFHHFGGYGGGCGYGCGDDAGYDRCGGGCARRHHRHHHDDCDDACGARYDRHADNDDDRDGRDGHDWHDGHDGHDDHDGHDGHGGRPDAAPPCATPRCYDAEHYEHRWRDGDRVGQDWYDRGHRERVLPDDKHSHNWYGHGSDNDWRDDDDDGPGDPPPPPPPGPPPHH